MVMLVGGRRGHVLDAMSAALRRHQRRMEPPRRVSPRMRVGARGGAHQAPQGASPHFVYFLLIFYRRKPPLRLLSTAASPHFVYIFYILLVWPQCRPERVSARPELKAVRPSGARVRVTRKSCVWRV